MVIKTNKWYLVYKDDYEVFKNKAERDTGLELNAFSVNNTFATPTINILYLKITSEGVLHYRTKFNERYMGDYTFYTVNRPAMTKLEVIPDEPSSPLDWLDEMVNDKEKNMIKDLLHNKYNELKTKLDKNYEESKEAIIADSELYKAAKKVADIIKKINVNCKVNINDIVNVNLYDINYLSKDQQIALDETYNYYKDATIKLQNKFQELETLLDLADTYEQKHDLLVKYEIIDKD